MKKVKVPYFFILFYFTSYISFSFIMTEFTPFLSSLGYDARYRGYILSGYAVTTILFQLWFGILSDRFQTIKKIVVVSLGAMGISAGMLFSNIFSYVAIHFLLVALAGGLFNTCCGMYDIWVMGRSEQLKNSLSFIKAFGSIGWAVGSMLASKIVLHFAYQGIAIGVIILVGVMLLNITVLGDIRQIPKRKRIKKTDLIELFKDRRYCLLLLVLFLMYAMVVTNNCTVVDKMMDLGADSRQISLKWSLQSLLEIPTYVAGAFLLRKFSSIVLLRISSIMLTVQFILFGVAQSANHMILISVMQLFSTPLILLASKMLIYDISPSHLRNSSQLIGLSLYTGASSLLVPSLAGTISIYVGYNITLLLVAGLGVASFFLIPKIWENIDKSAVE